MLNHKTISVLSILSIITLVVLHQFMHISWPFYFIPIGFWLVMTLCGSFLIQWNYHFTAIHSNTKIQKNQIALSFDDGPNAEFTPKILDLLEKYNAKATFFCIGQQVEKHQDIIQQIVEKGHTIGNHTYSHSKSFGFFNAKKVVEELLKTNTVVKDNIGEEMLLYRPAFGVTNPNIKKAIKETKLQAIGWNVRSLDTTPRSQSQILNRITRQLKKGDIILLHDTSKKTISVLEQLLLFLQEKNIESVTIDQLLDIKAYA